MVRYALTALLCVSPLWAPSAPRAGVLGDTRLQDLLEIRIIGRDLHAIDARGGNLTERLEIGESVLWRQARGRVGVVLTERRLLAVSTESARWQSERYLRTESPPDSALLGEQIALWISDKRLLALDGLRGVLVEEVLGPQERLLAVDLSANVAAVVTPRRALATAPRLAGFVETHLSPREGPFELSTRAQTATLVTSRRLLTFRAPTGSWGEQRRKLR